MLGIFLSPFTPRYSAKNNQISIKENTTSAQNNPGLGDGANNTQYVKDLANTSKEFDKNDGTCSFLHITTWHVCIVGWVYWLVFVPIAFLARLAAYVLDFFLFYSIQSGSYTGAFITEGWKTVRDIANIFFIIALLYVAIKTALALNASDNKRMIGMIVVIALIINFSLFATQMVVDASNILAKIFYANMEAVGADGELIPIGESSAKSITIGLVRTFDPQTIFGLQSVTDDLTKNNVGTFFTTMFMAILLMGYMVFMFLSVALLFVARVVMLWILMIFSPIAFISLTLPGVNIPGFGWREWSKQLFDNAFLAPIFLFMLYIIILFGDVVKIATGELIDTASPLKGTNIEGATNATFDTFLKVIIPFILIFVLLSKAKEIAVKMSGEMGAAINKVGGLAAGFAGGALLGGAAALGTKGIGRIANSMGDGKWAERLRDRGVIRDDDGNVIGAKKGVGAWLARQQLKTIDYGKKASFDVRQTKLGDFVQSKTGLNLASSSAIGLGPQKGGYLGYQERVDEQAKKDAELYKTSMSDSQVKEFTIARREKFLNEKADDAEQKLRDANKGVVLTDAQITIARNGAKDTYKDSAPRIYDKAEQLNQERMVMFKDRFGQTGLISALAHDSVALTGQQVNKNNYTTGDIGKAYLKAFKEKKKKQKREEAARNNQVFDETEFSDGGKFDTDQKAGVYDSEINKFDIGIAKTINDARANTAKMIIGGTLGVATGGALGIATGGVIAGTIAGGGSAINMGTREIDQSTTDKVIDRMDKEAKNTEKLANRIADLNKTLKDGKSIQRTQILDASGNPIVGTNGQPIDSGLFIQSAPGVDTDQVDKDKLKDAIARNKATAVALEDQVKKNPNNQQLRKDLAELYKEAEILKQLTTAEKELFELQGKKPNSGGGSTPPPATP